MIGNAHLDLAWLWRWEEAREEMIRTSQTVLQLMDEYPDFVYTCSQAAAYLWVEEKEPELFEKIKKKIQEGRWKIVGGWWVQPDVNIPSGESFIRQALYGKRYFREKFGVDVQTGYNVDSFGHTAQLPQILRHTGIVNYVFFRPKPNEKVLPSTLFRWQALDGTTVLASRPPFHYNSWAKELDSRIRLAVAEVDSHVGKEMLFYGVGDHGGGPTRENLESILRQKKELAGRADILFSDPESFFEAVKGTQEKRPLVQGELQYHSRGCYSSHSDIKRWNRFLESFLYYAETVHSLSAILRFRRYPAELLEASWKTLLFHQFHDILAGTSIPAVYEDAEKQLTEALLDTTRSVESAAGDLFQAVSERATGTLLVFNPLAWQRKERMTARVHLPGEAAGLTAKDPQGNKIPIQIHEQTFHPDAGTFFEISWVDDVPALGWKTYTFEASPEPFPFVEKKPIDVAETDFYRVKFNAKTGWIDEIFDKENGVAILSGAGNRLLVLHDPYDTWGHDVNEFTQEIGYFEPVSPFVLDEDGPVFLKIHVDTRFGESTARQTIFLYKKMRRIDFELDLVWEEKFKMLKIAFPVNVHEYQATFEVPFGAVGRPAFGTEEPLQRWMDVSGYAKNDGTYEQAYGVALLNDSKYAGSIYLSEMRLTVLRSPIFAKHAHGIPEDLTGLEFLDQGEQKIRYALFPHAGNWKQANLAREAEAFNQAPKIFWRKKEAEPDLQSFLEITPGNVVLSAFKAWENGEGWVLRLYESTGSPTTALVRLLFWKKQFRLTLRAFEIKTVLLTKKNGGVVATEINGMEEFLEDVSPLKLTDI